MGTTDTRPGTTAAHGGVHGVSLPTGGRECEVGMCVCLAQHARGRTTHCTSTPCVGWV